MILVTIRRLSSGYWYVKGSGPCNYAQPPAPPPWTMEYLREHAHPEASDNFLEAAARGPLSVTVEEPAGNAEPWRASPAPQPAAAAPCNDALCERAAAPGAMDLRLIEHDLALAFGSDPSKPHSYSPALAMVRAALAAPTQPAAPPEKPSAASQGMLTITPLQPAAQGRVRMTGTLDDFVSGRGRPMTPDDEQQRRLKAALAKMPKRG